MTTRVERCSASVEEKDNTPNKKVIINGLEKKKRLGSS
jgi:hypothetical protein